MSENTATGIPRFGGILKLLSMLAGGAEPVMDTEKAQKLAEMDAEHKALHYYGETVRTYTHKPYAVEGVCYYSGSKKHEDNLPAVLNFLQKHEISYALHSGSLYIFEGSEPTKVENENFILFRKSDNPIFSDMVTVCECATMMQLFDLPEDADLHPDDFSLAVNETHAAHPGNEG